MQLRPGPIYFLINNEAAAFRHRCESMTNLRVANTRHRVMTPRT
jgi:hypothetical protein